MSEAHPEWSDQAIEEAVAALLRTGLQLATTLVLVGAAIYLARHGSEQPEYRIFHGDLPTLRGLRGIIALSIDWRGRGIIMLGLLVLLATPVARVAFCMFAFAMQRDRLYVGITFVVLTVLLYSIVGGYM